MTATVHSWLEFAGSRICSGNQKVQEYLDIYFLTLTNFSKHIGVLYIIL